MGLRSWSVFLDRHKSMPVSMISFEIVIIDVLLAYQPTGSVYFPNKLNQEAMAANTGHSHRTQPRHL